MGYDTGSTSLLIFADEAHPLLFGAIHPVALAQIQLVTAAGPVNAHVLPLYMRMLTENHQHTLVDWHFELATVLPRPGPNAIRLSSLSLDNALFFCTPHLLDDYM
jgi:hypothetical protein